MYNNLISAKSYKSFNTKFIPIYIKKPAFFFVYSNITAPRATDNFEVTSCFAAKFLKKK